MADSQQERQAGIFRQLVERALPDRVGRLGPARDEPRTWLMFPDHTDPLGVRTFDLTGLDERRRTDEAVALIGEHEPNSAALITAWLAPRRWSDNWVGPAQAFVVGELVSPIEHPGVEAFLAAYRWAGPEPEGPPVSCRICEGGVTEVGGEDRIGPIYRMVSGLLATRALDRLT